MRNIVTKSLTGDFPKKCCGNSGYEWDSFPKFGIWNKLIEKINENHKVDFKITGPLSRHLPRNLHRDSSIIKLSTRKASAYRDRSLRERIRVLAARELSEVNKVTSQLQVVEAEAIQKIYLAEENNERRLKQGTIPKGKDYLRFDVTEEVWLDELTHYAVEVEKCPTPTIARKYTKARRASL